MAALSDDDFISGLQVPAASPAVTAQKRLSDDDFIANIGGSSAPPVKTKSDTAVSEGPPRGGTPNFGQITRSGGPPSGQPTIEDLLQPAPNTTYASLPWDWVAQDDKTGKLRFAMPSSIRNPLLDIVRGTVGAETTADPETGTIQYGLSPGASALAGVGAGPLRFTPRGGVPLEFVPPARSGGPLPPDTAANLLSPDARARAAEPPAGPTTATGVPVTPPAPVVAPPAAAPPPASATPAPGRVPMTSDAAKDVATAYYKTFDKAAQDGGSLTPQATNTFIANVEAAAPKPGIGQAVAGRNAITDLVDRLQPYKDKPMSLQDVQDIDRQLGNLVSAEYGKTGASDIGRQLQGIQHDFRDQAANPAPGDVVSGQAGLDALSPARKAYSQAMKLDTVERIQERANMTDNPTTSVRTQIRTLLNNDKLSRGFTDEEKTALRDAAERGATSTALHIMGSRLFPLIAGGVGSAGGFFGAVAGGTAGHFLNEGARWAENALAAKRMQNALSVIGRGVPPNPLQP